MPFISPSSDEFEKIDCRVMAQAYASQNELGRFCDECAYHADMKARLLAEGFQSVLTEIPVTVTHGSFSKKYYLDLVVDGGLYELKAQATFAGEDEAQLFNYIFLLGIQRGKLLNFRPPKVQGKIAATGLTQEDRRRFTTVEKCWRNITPGCGVLRQTMLELLQDWGAFLDIGLYQEALIHLLGGAGSIEQRVSLRRNGLDLGGQRMFIHGPGVRFSHHGAYRKAESCRIPFAPAAGINEFASDSMD